MDTSKKQDDILMKFYNLYNLDYKISKDDTLTLEDLTLLQKYTRKGSTGSRILLYRKPRSLKILYDLVMQCLSYGRRNVLEKYQVIYGEKLGTLKYKESNSKKSITLKNMVSIYGEVEGQKRFDDYCKKQSDKNKFEHKKKKYNWTKLQFDEFNKSRAITLDNMIKKYGDEEGSLKYKNYCDIQSKAGVSRDYFIEKYGYDIGMKQYVSMLISKIEKYTSKSAVADSFFDQLDYSLKCNSSYREYIEYFESIDKVFVYDYINHDLKICIEFQGDFFHMNPNKYARDSFNSMRNKSAIDIWEYDKLKKDMFMNTHPDYKYFSIWESNAIINFKNKEINKDFMLQLINDILGTN